ncbi:hypothetical protein [Enterococcus timonensis]|uniref:hypothetical protein n=1 Tax=Enterococcus timonensis TaxID=1852364 RepID=UPI0008D9B728|nr:hypothetical protein [Enterococcus timonensis]
MKPTKKRLEKQVQITRSKVLNNLREDRNSVLLDHVSSWWEQNDSDFEILKSHFQKVQDFLISNNVLVEFTNSLGTYFYGSSSRHQVKDFKEYKQHFFENLKTDSIPGYGKVQVPFDKKREVINEQYDAILANLDKLTAKKGVEYLAELGFDIDVFKEEEVQLPMVLVDKSKLGLPIKKAENV